MDRKSKPTKFNYTFLLLKIFCVLLLIFSAVVFIVQSTEILNNNYIFSLDSSGIRNIISDYDLTIQSLIAFIAFFTLWTYMKRIDISEKRIRQTEDELLILNQSHIFDIYIKHRDEFYKHFEKNNLIKRISQISKIPISDLMRKLHKDFYGATYKNFEAGLLKEKYEFGDDMNRFINENGLNDKQIDLEKLSLLFAENKKFTMGYSIDGINIKEHIDTGGVRAKAKINLKIPDRRLDEFQNIIEDIFNLKFLFNIYDNIRNFEGTRFTKDPKLFRKLDRDLIFTNIINFDYLLK